MCMTKVEIDMLSGPIVAMVWQGRDVVKTGRSKFHRRFIQFQQTLTDDNSHPRCHQPSCLRSRYHPW